MSLWWRAVVYRLGSVLLSTVVTYSVTGHIQFSVMLGMILAGFHTAYYIVFHSLWPKEG